jgi:hypothetical protein
MGAYPHINNCNIALDQLEKVKPGKFGTDTTFAKNRKAEILFLRAWAYYLVSNQFGDVPLLLSPKREDIGIYYYPKSSITDIYKRIIADLRWAYQNLPATQSDRGRVTKWAAGHLLAKLYLNRAQAAPFDINTTLDGRFGGNRSCNYHIGDYTNQTGVTRVMAYGRPFGTYKPTDWAYDNFRDKVNDSRYYKTFAYEYIGNLTGTSNTSFTWNTKAAAWWNANKPASEPTVLAADKRIAYGKRALIYLENQKSEALDSLMVNSQPFQFMVRWVRSATSGKYYYRLFIDGTAMGLGTTRTAPYLSSKEYVDPTRGGSIDEANFNSENGTRDAILMMQSQ